MTILYKSTSARGAVWATLLAELAPDLTFRQWPDTGDPREVTYLVAWQPPDDLMQFPNLNVLFSVGAGADQFDYRRLPPALPVVRMVEPGLTRGMVEYITWSVLGLHRGMPRYLHQQRWLEQPVRAAAHCRVGVMGLGELGTAVLQPLVQFGYPCAGWSRTPKNLPGVHRYVGEAQLPDFLARTDILVCLLPLTAATENILNAELFSQLPHGAGLVHAGRGRQLHQLDLLLALERQQLSAAVIDVTDPAPLPQGHPFWHHPAIWLTPHSASQPQAESAVRALLDNIRRFERGEPMHGLVDRARGY
ncbi:glyoxylate/hydroxypyruvate reductase A [Erwinia psidii]|uniref:2-hydroxyacid dehydrogenase n=1 Tax=Erwinia psidii TaxID=69224 RepID=UPI00226B289E|nr:glyoxylate/hydroxypyruvate reductase A [Erwinia psidii]MCX8965786.1 glyoxylate/hydroxypyruvate reductase A [Erwinia psidii]